MTVWLDWRWNDTYLFARQLSYQCGGGMVVLSWMLFVDLPTGCRSRSRSLALLWMLHSSPHLLSSSNPPTLPPEIVVVALPSNVLSSVVEIVAVQPNHSSTIFREWAHQPSLIWSSSCSSLTSLLIWSSDSSSPTSSSSLEVVASFPHAL